jgi:hypothetical protein
VGASEGGKTAVGGLAGPDDARRLVLGLGVCLWVHVDDQKEQYAGPRGSHPWPAAESGRMRVVALDLPMSVSGRGRMVSCVSKVNLPSLPGRLNCKGLPSNRSAAVWPLLGPLPSRAMSPRERHISHPRLLACPQIPLRLAIWHNEAGRSRGRFRFKLPGSFGAVLRSCGLCGSHPRGHGCSLHALRQCVWLGLPGPGAQAAVRG